LWLPSLSFLEIPKQFISGGWMMNGFMNVSGPHLPLGAPWSSKISNLGVKGFE
jgi:hypothetical protein